MHNFQLTFVLDSDRGKKHLLGQVTSRAGTLNIYIRQVSLEPAGKFEPRKKAQHSRKIAVERRNLWQGQWVEGAANESARNNAL